MNTHLNIDIFQEFVHIGLTSWNIIKQISDKPHKTVKTLAIYCMYDKKRSCFIPQLHFSRIGSYVISDFYKGCYTYVLTMQLFVRLNASFNLHHTVSSPIRNSMTLFVCVYYNNLIFKERCKTSLRKWLNNEV